MDRSITLDDDTTWFVDKTIILSVAGIIALVDLTIGKLAVNTQESTRDILVDFPTLPAVRDLALVGLERADWSSGSCGLAGLLDLVIGLSALGLSESDSGSIFTNLGSRDSTVKSKISEMGGGAGLESIMF